MFADGNRELVTVIEAISAAGRALHPTILFKGKTMQRSWVLDRLLYARYGNTERGWTNDDEGIGWVQDFVCSTSPYVLLYFFNCFYLDLMFVKNIPGGAL